jgi:hypothetical protein
MGLKMEILNIIQSRLSDFFKENPLNKVDELENLIIFDEPLIGIASVFPILDINKTQKLRSS